MTEVILYGKVAKLFPAKHTFYNINKPSDCLEAIDANYEGFKNFFKNTKETNALYEMIVDGDNVKSAKDAFGKKEIKKIEIVPIITGSDPVSLLTTFTVNLILGLVVAGIQYLLTTIPEDEPIRHTLTPAASSFAFANEQNVASQFTPVPIGYGALRIGSKIIESQRKTIDLGVSVNEKIIASAGGGSAGEGGIGSPGGY
jgi:predicted phage tail protein